MKNFDWNSKYLVYLRGAGNSDFRQFTDVAPIQVKLVSSLEEAQDECQKYIAQHQLGSGNWYTLELPCPGDVFDMKGVLKKQIAYNGTLCNPEEKRSLPNFNFKLQLDSWNSKQSDKLETKLQEIGAREIVTEDWRGGQDDPAVITYCKVKGSIDQISKAVKAVSKHIHLSWIELVSDDTPTANSSGSVTITFSDPGMYDFTVKCEPGEVTRELEGQAEQYTTAFVEFNGKSYTMCQFLGDRVWLPLDLFMSLKAGIPDTADTI